MTEIKPYMCSCCNEIWSRENQKSIKLGKYELHLCPNCYHEYIISNNAVLDKIRAEIETKYGHCDICEYFEDYDYEENDISEYRPIGDIAEILQIIDRHMKGDSE